MMSIRGAQLSVYPELAVKVFPYIPSAAREPYGLYLQYPVDFRLLHPERSEGALPVQSMS